MSLVIILCCLFMILVTLSFHFFLVVLYCFHIVPSVEWIKYTSCWSMLKLVSESEELRQIKIPISSLSFGGSPSRALYRLSAIEKAIQCVSG